MIITGDTDPINIGKYRLDNRNKRGKQMLDYLISKSLSQLSRLFKKPKK